MNCLEFRRRLAVEPDNNVVEFRAHRDGCARCGETYDRAQSFELRLAGALAVPVPEGLAERMLLRQTTEARQGQRSNQRRQTIWRMAAGFLIAVGAASMWGFSQRVEALPDLAVAHLNHEPFALSSRAQVADSQVRALFAARGVQLATDAGPVNYLQLCKIGDNYAVHMVVQEADGPVTVYYVIGRREATRSVFERAGVMGREAPVGDGTLVLLASHDSSFDLLERHWLQALGAGTDAAVGEP